MNQTSLEIRDEETNKLNNKKQARKAAVNDQLTGACSSSSRPSCSRRCSEGQCTGTPHSHGLIASQ